MQKEKEGAAGGSGHSSHRQIAAKIHTVSKHGVSSVFALGEKKGILGNNSLDNKPYNEHSHDKESGARACPSHALWPISVTYFV